MRSTSLKTLATALVTTSLGVGWVSAGNLDQLNYYPVTGANVSDLRTIPANDAIFPETPWNVAPYIELMNPALQIPPETFIESTGGNPQNSATWIRGFIEPPETGEYTFWVTGLTDAEFWLSSNTTSGGKVLEAYTGGTTGVDDWARRLTQKSRRITLTKGQQYYFELIQKSSGVGGHAQLGWWLPSYQLQRPIPIRYAQRFAFAADCLGDFCTGSFVAERSVPTPIFDRKPGNNTSNFDTQIIITENQPYDLSPWMTAQYPVTFQWQEMVGYVPGGSQGTATDITVANGYPQDENISAKFIAKATIAEHDNKAYRVRATRNANTATSTVAYLSVFADTTAPSIVGVSTAGSTNGFNVVFSENVDPNTATNKNNYTVSNGVVIDRVEMRYGETPNNVVVVYTTTGIPGLTTLTVSNVRDLAVTPNTITPNSVADILLTDGIITYFAYGAINGGAAIGGTAIQDMINATNRVTLPTGPFNDRHPFPGRPDIASTRPNIGIQQNVANDYGVVLVGFVVPPEDGLYNIVISGDDQSIVYIGNTADPASKYPAAADPQWNGYRGYTTVARRTMANTGNSGFITANFPGSPAAEQNATIKVNQAKNTIGGVAWLKGNKYYIEALMKEGGGGDNVDVTWQLPNTWNFGDDAGLADGQAPIPGLYLSQFATAGQSGPISIVTQPADKTTLENRPTTFSVVHGGSPSFSYQWYKNGIIIPDANAREYTEQLPDPVTENNAKYTVVVRNLFSGATSAEATLTVTPDLVGPTIVRAVGSASFNTVTIWFDEVVDPATAVNRNNYSIAGLNITANGTLTSPAPGGFTRVVFPTAPQTQGQQYTITVNNVRDIANSSNVITPASTVSFTGWVVSKGFALYEVWWDINGGNVNTVKADPRYPGNPSRSTYKTLWESDQDIAEQFGGKLSGYFYAASGAGRYDFYMASDDNGELWLANTSAAGSVLTRLGFEPAWGNRRSWTGTSDGRRTSGDNHTEGDNLAILTMTANERRYMELIYKEGGGGDYGDATFKFQGQASPALGAASALRGGFIGALANPDETSFTFSQNLPATATFAEGVTTTFTVAGTGQTLTDKLNNPQTTSAVFWQWQKMPAGGAWTDIANANGTSYTTPVFTPADNQARWRVQANIPGLTTTSVEVLVTVVIDNTRPTVLSVSALPAADGVQNRVLVVFDEPVQAAQLTTLSNYLLTQGGTPVTISGAVARANNSQVILTTAALTPNTTYDLVVRDIRDPSTAQNLLNPNPTPKQFKGWVQQTGYVRREQYNGSGPDTGGVGGDRLARLLNNPTYPNNPDVVDFRNVVETPTNIREDFGQRLSGYLTPTETADYLFAIAADDQSVLYLSPNEDPAQKVAIVTDPEWGGVRDYNGNDRRINSGVDTIFGNIDTLPVNRSQNTVGAKNLVAGQKYYFEVLTKEGGGGDNCAVTWWKSTDPMPANGSTPIQGSAVTAWVNPDNTINVTAQPQSQQRGIGTSVTFSVTANATSPLFGGPIRYQWRRDTGGGPVNIGGATGSSYTDADVQAGDYGTYDVVMTAPGAPNVTSAAATLSSAGVPPPTLAIAKNGNNVVVTYPTTAQADGHALQKSTGLTSTPGATFAADASGSDVAGVFTTTVDVTAPAAEGESYWRTRK